MLVGPQESKKKPQDGAGGPRPKTREKSQWDLGGGGHGGDVLALVRAELRPGLQVQDDERRVQQPRVRERERAWVKRKPVKCPISV